MGKAGLSGEYPDMLDPWIQMLNQGLTTFAEEPEPRIGSQPVIDGDPFQLILYI